VDRIKTQLIIMKDITYKIETLRIAKASAVLKLKAESIKAIKANSTPKKDVLATARAAGFLAVKNTSNVIPHCHPIPIESVIIDFEFKVNAIRVITEVKSTYKTGCEMEALHGASIATLTIYDMMKPIDKNIIIKEVKLLSKSGGKSDYINAIPQNLKTAVIVISDSVSKKKKTDKTGVLVKTKLKELGIKVEYYGIVPDETIKIRNQIRNLCKRKFDLILTAGGTGVSKRDDTPEAVKLVIDKEVPGIMEAARNYGQLKTPYAMLSRGVAGLTGNTLIITLPGSSKGAEETIDAVFPHVLHVFSVMKKNYRHGK
jgi:cyclic pyranopterin phosphate synthase